MDISYQNIDRTPTSSISDQFVLKLKSISRGGYLLIALGIITLIGSLVATGCLYSQLGYTSFAIGGTGVVLSILCFFLSRYCRDVNGSEEPEEEVLDTLTKCAEKEEDAYLIDFSIVNPSNILKIFDNRSSHGVYGDTGTSDRISYDESSKFTQNFPYAYSISTVTVEKNEHGFNTSCCYTFTMNDEGKVESYGKVFDNFDLYLEHLQKRVYGHSFEHFDFQSVPTKSGHKKLRKKSSATVTK